MNRNSPGLTYYLWRFSDVQMIDALAEKWMGSVRPGTNAMYLLAFLALTTVTGVLTWFFDIRPSLAFATYVSQNAFAGPGTAPTSQIAAVLSTFLIAILSIMPNLLEFFTVGLALQGNLAVDISIKFALVFDAITDAPGAHEFSRAVIAYFTNGLPESFLPAIPVVEIFFTAPVLLLATIVIETLFLSFLLTSLRLFRLSMQRGRQPQVYTP